MVSITLTPRIVINDKGNKGKSAKKLGFHLPWEKIQFGGLSPLSKAELIYFFFISCPGKSNKSHKKVLTVVPASAVPKK